MQNSKRRQLKSSLCNQFNRDDHEKLNFFGIPFNRINTGKALNNDGNNEDNQ